MCEFLFKSEYVKLLELSLQSFNMIKVERSDNLKLSKGSNYSQNQSLAQICRLSYSFTIKFQQVFESYSTFYMSKRYGFFAVYNNGQFKTLYDIFKKILSIFQQHESIKYLNFFSFSN